jgi:hypothetical protein
LMKLIKGGQGTKDGRNFDLIAGNGKVDAESAITSPQLLRPSLYAHELQDFSFQKTGLSIARQLIGSRASFAGDVANYKPKQLGGPTPWHQDEAFREPNFDYQEISIWIALTDVTLENGPMAYVPGSHRVGILPHRLYGGSQESNSIECCEGFDERTAVVCPVPAGAMIIHHCRTVHGASANKTNDERLAYALSFSTPLKLRKKFREFPWLKNLRKPLINRRTQSMQRGGLLSELVRVARSELLIQKVFRNFFLRRVNQLRGLFRRS